MLPYIDTCVHEISNQTQRGSQLNEVMVFPDQTPTLKMKLDTKRRKLNTQREMFNFNYIVLLAFNCFGEMKCFLSISFFFCCLLLLLDSSSFREFLSHFYVLASVLCFIRPQFFVYNYILSQFIPYSSCYLKVVDLSYLKAGN